MSILTENWHTWFIGGVDSEFRLRFLKFRLQNPFLGKFGSKNSKLSVLTENWHTWCLRFQIRTYIFEISTPKSIFWANLGRKSQNCPFFLKIGMHGILTMLILIPTLVFWISDPKSIFGKIWTKKVKVVQFGWKLAHRVSRRCWFLFRHYFSQFPTLNPFLDKFGPKKSKLYILTKNWHTFILLLLKNKKKVFTSHI